MSRLFFVALLAAMAAPMQTPTQTTTTPAAGAKTVADNKTSAIVSPAAPLKNDLAPNEAVVTIHGLCSGAQSAKTYDAKCSTVITKQQFDAILSGLNAIGAGAILPMQRRNIAEGYTTTLIKYEAAKRAGVERDPRFAEVMRLAKMRAMGDMYQAFLEEKAKKVSAKEIETYYNTHRDQFEELTMRHIQLPRFNMANLKDQAYAAKARKIIDDVHERMVKGEDPDKLQKEAFEALGVQNPPTTHMAAIRRGMYSPEEEKQIFALKPGESTAVMELPSALIILKLEHRETPSLEKSKDEIARIITKENLEKEEKVRADALTVDFNQEYLGPSNSGWMTAGQIKSAEQSAKGGAAKNAPATPSTPK